MTKARSFNEHNEADWLDNQGGESLAKAKILEDHLKAQEAMRNNAQDDIDFDSIDSFTSLLNDEEMKLNKTHNADNQEEEQAFNDVDITSDNALDEGQLAQKNQKNTDKERMLAEQRRKKKEKESIVENVNKQQVQSQQEQQQRQQQENTQKQTIVQRVKQGIQQRLQQQQEQQQQVQRNTIVQQQVQRSMVQQVQQQVQRNAMMQQQVMQQQVQRISIIQQLQQQVQQVSSRVAQVTVMNAQRLMSVLQVNNVMNVLNIQKSVIQQQMQQQAVQQQAVQQNVQIQQQTQQVVRQQDVQLQQQAQQKQVVQQQHVQQHVKLESIIMQQEVSAAQQGNYAAVTTAAGVKEPISSAVCTCGVCASCLGIAKQMKAKQVSVDKILQTTSVRPIEAGKMASYKATSAKKDALTNTVCSCGVCAQCLGIASAASASQQINTARQTSSAGMRLVVDKPAFKISNAQVQPAILQQQSALAA